MHPHEPPSSVQHRRRKDAEREQVLAEVGCARCEDRERNHVEGREVVEDEKAENGREGVEREGEEDRAGKVGEEGEQGDEGEGEGPQAVVGLRQVGPARSRVREERRE